MRARRKSSLTLAVLLSLAVTGCASIEQRTSYTAEQAERAEIPGMPNVRFSGDAPASVFERLRNDVVRAAQARHEPVTYLALSGGGGDGAYGAGFLKGLGETGRRPQFTIVSGVSTGALMAPFVFLGSNYDAMLGDLYTSGYAATLVKNVNVLNGLFGNALVDSDKLMQLIKQDVTDDMIQRIAAEHRAGRRLLIASTNLDSQHSEIWDMGAIANSGSPRAPKLFRQVLAASASVPGLFPPRLIDVEADGKGFEEMHVDGGTLRQLYVAPDEVIYGAGSGKAGPGIRDLYILVNNKIDPTFDLVDNATIPVGTRSLSTILKREGRNNVLSAYAYAMRNRIGYHLAFIDPEVRDLPADDPKAEFSVEYMSYLYNLGEEKGKSTRPWNGVPPFAQGTTVQQTPSGARPQTTSSAPAALIAPTLGTGG
jgi:Patatin-like phospholipase